MKLRLFNVGVTMKNLKYSSFDSILIASAILPILIYVFYTDEGEKCPPPI